MYQQRGHWHARAAHQWRRSHSTSLFTPVYLLLLHPPPVHVFLISPVWDKAYSMLWWCICCWLRCHILLLWNILLFTSKLSSVLTSFPCASAAHHLSVSSALLSVSASSACSPAVFLLGYWAWSPQEALDSPFSKETEFLKITDWTQNQ